MILRVLDSESDGGIQIALASRCLICAICVNADNYIVSTIRRFSSC